MQTIDDHKLKQKIEIKIKERKPTLLAASARKKKEGNKARTTPHAHGEEKEAMRD